jgi:membrane protein
MIGLPGVPFRQFLRELKSEISDDNVGNGAAALAYYLMLAVFPGLILLFALLPYLPIQHLDQALMDLLRQTLPGETADLFDQTIQQVTRQKRGGLLSLGIIGTLWAASNGLFAVMQQLNITYDVKEGRPFWKTRGIALLLTLVFGALLVTAFALIVLGGELQGWLASTLGWETPLRLLFAILRWVIIGACLLLGFALVYYWGPDVEQRFRFISPGAVFGVLVLALASLGFRAYVTNFGNYSATYGSLGAVIVLLLWLFITGWVLLLGSELNALFEHHLAEGKQKGEKREPPEGTGPGKRRGPPPQRRTPPPATPPRQLH